MKKKGTSDKREKKRLLNLLYLLLIYL